MQPDEVGTRTGSPLRKQVREGGSTTERTPMVMGSRPMVIGGGPMVIGSRPLGKETAALMNGSITLLSRGGGKFRWMDFFAFSVDCSSSLRGNLNRLAFYFIEGFRFLFFGTI